MNEFKRASECRSAEEYEQKSAIVQEWANGVKIYWDIYGIELPDTLKDDADHALNAQPFWGLNLEGIIITHSYTNGEGQSDVWDEMYPTTFPNLDMSTQKVDVKIDFRATSDNGDVAMKTMEYTGVRVDDLEEMFALDDFRAK